MCKGKRNKGGEALCSRRGREGRKQASEGCLQAGRTQMRIVQDRLLPFHNKLREHAFKRENFKNFFKKT